jgi:hypothetical protein
MSNKPEFVTSHRLPKGSVWKVKAELVGGTRLWRAFRNQRTPCRGCGYPEMLSKPSKGSGVAVRQSGR